MKQSRKVWRASFFVLLLAALCGSFAFPFAFAPVNAAPQMQATACLGTTFTEWTFENVTTPSTGAGTYSAGSGLPAHTFNGGSPGQAIQYANWTLSATLDPNYYVEFAVPTDGRNTIGLDFEYRATGTGPQFLEVHYSTDGGANFTPLGTAQTLTRDSNFNPLSFDFSAIPAIEDNASAIFRIYGYAAGGAGGNLRLDNVAFTGNCINPVPATPTVAPLGVLINEVAWSGTVAANTDEWFELYNSTGNDIDLTGWELVSDDGNPSIILSGTILAGDYFVVARSNLVFNDLVPDLTYSGTFENNPDAESLYLLDANGNQIDTANVDGGAWNAGSASPTFASMERVGTTADGPLAWNTYGGTVAVAHDRNGNDIKGTPGQANWISTVTATPTATTTGTPTLTPTRTLSPTPLGLRSILINEIAWAGTGASTSDEWIELYNPATTAVNLVGWVLKAPDGSPNISLTGTIPAGGFYLLERTDDTTVLDVPANQIYTGEIENSFESLQLFDPSNRLIDTANANGGNWPAGISERPYNTMERRGNIVDSDTAWITNSRQSTWFAHDARGINSSEYLIRGTPGRANWAYSVTATPSPKPTLTRTRTPTRVPTRPPAFLVAINEFVPRPGHDWNNDGEVNVQDEYIEILNHGTIDVPLGGYTLDDEANEGSEPFRLPSVTLSPGERIVFYGSETGLHLSDGGDGVRLLRPNGQLMDAFNYTVARFADQSYCRLPDNGGLDDWSDNCFPTPGLQNSLSGDFVEPIAGGETERLCPIADTLPEDFVLAECPGFGNNIWRRTFWDEEGWYGEKMIPVPDRRWDVYAD